jgi:hypothetical protein
MLAVVAALLMLAVAGGGAVEAQPQPVAQAASTCDEHPNQASAQRAKDTRDPDGDDISCVIYSHR